MKKIKFRIRKVFPIRNKKKQTLYASPIRHAPPNYFLILDTRYLTTLLSFNNSTCYMHFNFWLVRTPLHSQLSKAWYRILLFTGTHPCHHVPQCLIHRKYSKNCLCKRTNTWLDFNIFILLFFFFLLIMALLKYKANYYFTHTRKGEWTSTFQWESHFESSKHHSMFERPA